MDTKNTSSEEYLEVISACYAEIEELIVENAELAARLKQANRSLGAFKANRTRARARVELAVVEG